MKFFPFEDFEINTTLSSREVFYRLRSAVESKKTWWILPLFINKPFFGKVGRDNFRISRVTWWNPNFSLVISGKIQPEVSGSRVLIKMRLHWFVFFFWAFWLGAVGYIFFGGVTNLILQRIQTGVWQIDSPLWLLPLVGMFAFGYLLVIGNFKKAADHSTEIFMKSFGVGQENVIFKDKIFGLTEFQIINMLLLVTVVVAALAVVVNLVM